MQQKCPGLSSQELSSTIAPCPKCGTEVEIFSDESSTKCSNCRTPVYKKAVPTCAAWCKAASLCIGPRDDNPKETEKAEA